MLVVGDNHRDDNDDDDNDNEANEETDPSLLPS